MKLPRRNFLQLAGGAAALSSVSRIARAQTYPSRPVRLVAATTAGSAPDAIARLMGQWLSERLGQPFIVENRPGAGGNLGTEAVVGRRPTVYSLLLVLAGTRARLEQQSRKTRQPSAVGVWMLEFVSDCIAASSDGCRLANLVDSELLRASSCILRCSPTR